MVITIGYSAHFSLVTPEIAFRPGSLSHPLTGLRGSFIPVFMQSNTQVSVLIQEAFAGVTLPRGPSGLTGDALELRRYFSSPLPGMTAKALYRGLVTPDKRAEAIAVLRSHTFESAGVNARDWGKLERVAALPVSEKRRGRRVTLTVCLDAEHATFLDETAREQGGNHSSALRYVLDMVLASQADAS